MGAVGKVAHFFVRNGNVPEQANFRIQRPVNIQQRRVLAQTDSRLVDQHIELLFIPPVAACAAGNERLDLAALLFERLRIDVGDRVGFQKDTDGEGVMNILVRIGLDKCAAIRVILDQSLACQPPDGRTQRRTAHAQLLRDALLWNFLARGITAGKNLLLQRFINQHLIGGFLLLLILHT